MCYKIRCDGESWKFFGFQRELNKASIFVLDSPLPLPWLLLCAQEEEMDFDGELTT